MDREVMILRYPTIHTVAGEPAILDFETEQFYLLNCTACDIVRCLNEGICVYEIVSHLAGLYDATFEDCKLAVQSTLGFLEENGYVMYKQA